MSLCTRAVFQETDVDSSVVCAMPALLLCSWAPYLPLPLFCTSLYASALGAAPALLRSRHARSLVMLFDSTSTSLLYFDVLLWFLLRACVFLRRHHTFPRQLLEWSMRSHIPSNTSLMLMMSVATASTSLLLMFMLKMLSMFVLILIDISSDVEIENGEKKVQP